MHGDEGQRLENEEVERTAESVDLRASGHDRAAGGVPIGS
jgi:hypothetical protein